MNLGIIQKKGWVLTCREEETCRALLDRTAEAAVST